MIKCTDKRALNQVTDVTFSNKVFNAKSQTKKGHMPLSCLALHPRDGGFSYVARSITIIYEEIMWIPTNFHTISQNKMKLAASTI